MEKEKNGMRTEEKKGAERKMEGRPKERERKEPEMEPKRKGRKGRWNGA
jgi:hypothetical protein